MDFKARCAESVLGKPIESVLPLFGGQESRDLRGTTYSWKAWPCELVVEDGAVIGVFYRDFPFTMQRLPPDWRRTHPLPYFERHPAFLGEEYTGRWDGRGGYGFEKTAGPR